MKSPHLCTLFAAVALSGTLADSSRAGSVIEGPRAKGDATGGAMTFGYQGSEEMHTGYADLLQPLYSSGKEFAIFYDGRLSLDDDDQDMHSHGLVIRYRVPDRDIILGANIYYDSVNSGHDHHFDQLGLGLEVLTKWVDFRANYYLPDQKREAIDQRNDVLIEPPTVQTDVQLVGRRLTGGGSISIPIYARRSYVQFGPDSFQRRELTRFESPLEGLDTELGFLIPGLHRYAEVRIFGGYYHYVNPYGTDYDGFKARLEARVRRGIIADVEYWSDDELNGGHWTAGLRVSLPFNLANIFAGRNPFEGAGEAFGPPSEDFSDRMTDMIVRSSRVKTTTSGYVTTKLQKATGVSFVQEGKRFTIMPNFDTEGSAAGGLTFEIAYVGGSSSGAIFSLGSITPENQAAMQAWLSQISMTLGNFSSVPQLATP